jgi:hypothetical protein
MSVVVRVCSFVSEKMLGLSTPVNIERRYITHNSVSANKKLTSNFPLACNKRLAESDFIKLQQYSGCKINYDYPIKTSDIQV